MFVDLRRRYGWVLPTQFYENPKQLIADLGERVIRPAEDKVAQLGAKLPKKAANTAKPKSRKLAAKKARGKASGARKSKVVLKSKAKKKAGRRRWAAGVVLHLGQGSAYDLGVCVDEGQILFLLGGEAEVSRWGKNVGHLIHLLCPDHRGAAMNVRYRVELSQAEREQLGAPLSGKPAARRLKRAQILLAANGG